MSFGTSEGAGGYIDAMTPLDAFEGPGLDGRPGCFGLVFTEEHECHDPQRLSRVARVF